jgi:hypothetical protein
MSALTRPEVGEVAALVSSYIAIASVERSSAETFIAFRTLSTEVDYHLAERAVSATFKNVRKSLHLKRRKTPGWRLIPAL